MKRLMKSTLHRGLHTRRERYRPLWRTGRPRGALARLGEKLVVERVPRCVRARVDRDDSRIERRNELGVSTVRSVVVAEPPPIRQPYRERHVGSVLRSRGHANRFCPFHVHARRRGRCVEARARRILGAMTNMRTVDDDRYGQGRLDRGKRQHRGGGRVRHFSQRDRRVARGGRLTIAARLPCARAAGRQHKGRGQRNPKARLRDGAT